MPNSLSINVWGDISNVFANGLDVAKGVRAQKAIVIREYKAQTPVDKDFLRKSVVAENIPGGFSVEAKINYATPVHGGTGSLRGSADQGARGVGRVRSGTVARGIGGIRPNRFADRTREAVKDDVFKGIRMALFNQTRETVPFTTGGRGIGGAFSPIK